MEDEAMRVWDARTQQLTPEWIAHSKLVKEFCVGDVLILGCGRARISRLTLESGDCIYVEAECFEMGDDEGGTIRFRANPIGRMMIDPTMVL